MARSPRPRVFLDTNVIFSGFHSPSGPPAQILRLHIEGAIQAIVSQQVLEELARTIAAKLPSAAAPVRALLVSAPPEVVPDPPLEMAKHWAKLVDPVDAPVIAAAVQAGADYFVTGDKVFLGKAREIAKSGIAVLSPRQLVEKLE
ncbi:MAG: putative toxin-antitoxin system toxin component, PIN family [Chloroflexi bacterium]|nr:putative toxin-antitoxin system toxin component, PIN family [Chloroflexota bacterium]